MAKYEDFSEEAQKVIEKLRQCLLCMDAKFEWSFTCEIKSFCMGYCCANNISIVEAKAITNYAEFRNFWVK